ncbi:MAG: helix-turn-helix domain-containing protein [Hyphomicrobium sp.]
MASDRKRAKTRSLKITSKPKTDRPAAVRSKGLTTGSGAPEVMVRTLEQAIGAQVRTYRKMAGLTVSELATAAEISAGMLSRIENGQISPSLGTLQLLSNALNLPISILIASTESARSCSYVKRGEGVAINRRGTKVGHHYQLLGQSVGGNIAVEPYFITLGKDAEAYTEFRHEGIEFIYMLDGELMYAHGESKYHLQPGDSILFDSADLHGPERLIRLPAIYLSIIVYLRGS